MEHRWGERIVVDLPVQVSTPPLMVGNGRILNVSISGAWISGQFDLPPLARAMIIFDFNAGSRPEPMPIPCYIARVRSQGIGVEWRELAPQIVSDLLLFAASVNPNSVNDSVHSKQAPQAPDDEILALAKTYAG